ncbi:MAG: hypothetical protein AAGA63_13160 [Pseudomonadota bacterium]
MTYQKPAHWADPTKKLFPYQVGFTAPPYDFDAAPSDFLRICPETVGVHGRMLHAPGYGHQIADRKKNFGLLEDFVECMANNGVDVCGQIGSNWVHASGMGPDGIAAYCREVSDKYETPFHMAGYTMVEALRSIGAEKIAINATYHWPAWWQGAERFLKAAGFDVLYAGNFVSQGLFESQDEVNEKIWIFDGALAAQSTQYVAEQAPDADAIVITGMCNFRRSDGLPQRVLHVAPDLEALTGVPVIGSDVSLYWRIFKELRLQPADPLGALLRTL